MKGSIVLVVVCVGVMMAGCTTVNLTPEQKESIRQAAQKVLPQGSEVSVDTQGQDVVIAAHLLEGHSSDERSPYVRGDYGTHEKLTRLVRFRSARVIRSVLQDAQLTGVGGILIHTRHGVRQSYVGQSFSGTDVAMTLYTVRFAITDGANGAPVIPTEDAIIQQFTVKKNIIPSLSFSRSPF
ncbi:MAG: hypothetical protein OEW48_18840 [Phycisphaerae bacterium]|nr:hypothetical protein [Phycisphaerae bacterium]